MSLVNQLVEDDYIRNQLRILLRMGQRCLQDRRIDNEDFVNTCAFLFDQLVPHKEEDTQSARLIQALQSFDWNAPQTTKAAIKTMVSIIGRHIKAHDRRVRSEVARQAACRFFILYGRDETIKAFSQVPMPKRGELPLFPEHRDTCHWPILSAWLRGENNYYNRWTETCIKRAMKNKQCQTPIYAHS